MSATLFLQLMWMDQWNGWDGIVCAIWKCRCLDGRVIEARNAKSGHVRRWRWMKPEVCGTAGINANRHVYRIETWALEEARRRLEKEGILPEPEDEP